MVQTEELTTFLNNFSVDRLNSNLVISDLDRIIYARTDGLNNKYINKNLDSDH